MIFKSLLSNPGQTGRERNVGQARAVAESIVADFCHALGNIDPDQPYLAKAPLYVNLPQAPGQLQFRQVAGAKSAFLNAPHILGHGVAFPVYGTPQQPDPNLSNGTPFLIRNRDSLSTHGGRTSPGISLSAFRRPLYLPASLDSKEGWPSHRPPAALNPWAAQQATRKWGVAC